MFVTFEGVDWSGKSTQAELLAGWLRDEGRTVVATREPGGTPVAEGVRDLVLHGATWRHGRRRRCTRRRAPTTRARDPARARARRGRGVRPLPGLVGRLPGDRAAGSAMSACAS